jgi:hypothetical protein
LFSQKVDTEVYSLMFDSSLIQVQLPGCFTILKGVERLKLTVEFA